MQKLQIFAIYDKKAQAYILPHFFHQKGQAIRALEDAVNEVSNPNNQIARHPSDFVLCHLGDFDDRTGIVLGLTAPVILEEANNLKSVKN